MVQPGQPRHRYTYAEYVALELTSDTKHEFFDGEIYGMAGGSEEHSALATRVLAALDAAIGDRPCRVHTSDLRVFVEAVGLATFPDGTVIRGALVQHESSPAATATNPSLILEVTSDSSEEYDCGNKLAAYQTITTVREVILVSHRERRVTVHARGADGTWAATSAGPGGQVALPSLAAALVVDDVYRRSAIR